VVTRRGNVLNSYTISPATKEDFEKSVRKYNEKYENQR